jgi:hypothetical protein
MSANQSDDALQRLNYFNGQRLAAADFRAEQGHHLGMRRVINRSLYSPGIVVGLEVIPAQSNPPDLLDKHRVVVKHGLAFDNLGREIFLPVDVAVQVMGAPRSAPGVVFGNLLVVSYRETRRFPAQGQCSIGAPFRPCSGEVAWGAPTRIVADAVFEFVDSWPSDESGKIVLSQIELDAKCTVVRTSPGVRRYAVPAKPQTVRPISLEGEKDIAFGSGNGKTLHFHIDGGFPEQALVYLRGRHFSELHYTEIGQHHHALLLDTKLIGAVPAHVHHLDLTNVKLNPGGDHRHEIWSASDDGESGSIDYGDADDLTQFRSTGEGGVLGGRANMEVKPSGPHAHTIDATTVPDTKPGGEVPAHKHGIDGQSQDTGMLPGLRTGAAYTYPNHVKVLVDGIDVTVAICQQLSAKQGQAGRWLTLGDGTDTHALCTPEGTGAIDLLRLGYEIGLGPHTLEFRIEKAGGGGLLQYNLYVS